MALGAVIFVGGLVVTNQTAAGFVLLATVVAGLIVFLSYRKYADT